MKILKSLLKKLRITSDKTFGELTYPDKLFIMEFDQSFDLKKSYEETISFSANLENDFVELVTTIDSFFVAPRDSSAYPVNKDNGEIKIFGTSQEALDKEITKISQKIYQHFSDSLSKFADSLESVEKTTEEIKESVVKLDSNLKERKYFKTEIGRNRVKYFAVFDKIPENNPEPFKKSSLIYHEIVELEFWRPQSTKANIHCSFRDKEGLESELRIYNAIEISEAEFESIKMDAKDIIRQTNNLLDIYNNKRYDKTIQEETSGD